MSLERRDLDAAWQAVFDVLADGWTVVWPVFDADERRWHVTALGPRPLKPGRQPMVEAVGRTEAKSLWDLAMLLEQWVPE